MNMPDFAREKVLEIAHKLIDANLQGLDLSGTNLRGANLRQAVLLDADLERADLREADLRGAVYRTPGATGTMIAGAAGTMISGAPRFGGGRRTILIIDQEI